jgi:hypothetical protein
MRARPEQKRPLRKASNIVQISFWQNKLLLLGAAEAFFAAWRVDMCVTGYD